MTKNDNHGFSPWEYLVRDFLDIACKLDEESQLLLVEELRLENGSKKSLDIHSTFSIGGRLISVLKNQNPNECWLYYPEKQKIEKYKLKNA